MGESGLQLSFDALDELSCRSRPVFDFFPDEE